MSRFQTTCILVAWSMLIISCGKQPPQLPSNKNNSIDKNAISLLAINENLAKKEDAYLKKIALQKDKSFKKNEIGFWYNIDKLQNGLQLKDSVICRFKYTLFSLNGKLLKNEEKQIVIGKKQVVVGLEEGLKLMKKGENATFIIPWYLAFGMKGDEPLIPPYTSLIYKVIVFN